MGVLGFLGGFSDAASRSQAQGAQNRMQGLDTMLRLKLLQHQLQQDQLRQAAIGKLPPDQQQELMLGGSIEDIKNRQEKTSAAGSMAGEFDIRASDTTLPPTQRQQFRQLAQYLRKNPSASADLGTTLKLFGIGEKPSKSFIPNALTARAMQILGTTDPSVLAQHPEALVQAQRENLEQQKQVAAQYRQPRETPDEAYTMEIARRRAEAAVPMPEKPVKPKEWTTGNFLAARKSAMEQAKMELTKPGYISKGEPSGPQILGRANDLLAEQGVNPQTGKKLKDGDRVRLSDGRTVTWRE